MVSPSTLPRRCRTRVPTSGLSSERRFARLTVSDRNPGSEACSSQPIRLRSVSPLPLPPRVCGSELFIDDMPASPKPGPLWLASAKTALLFLLPKSILKRPLESVYPIERGDALHTSCLTTDSGGGVPSSSVTLPDAYKGRCIVTGNCVCF